MHMAQSFFLKLSPAFKLSTGLLNVVNSAWLLGSYAKSIIAACFLIVFLQSNFCFGIGQQPEYTDHEHLSRAQRSRGLHGSEESDPGSALDASIAGTSAVRSLLQNGWVVINVWDQPFEGTANHQTHLSLNRVFEEGQGNREYVGWVPAGITPDAEVVEWRGSRNRTLVSCSSNGAFHITASHLIFRSFQVQGCSQTEVAAVVVASGVQNVTFEDCVFNGNNQGGALEAAAGSTVVLRNVLIANNTIESDLWRGAAITTAGELRLDSCEIRDTKVLNSNDKLSPGSLAVLPGGRLTSHHTTFQGNFGRTGGAVSVGTASGGATAEFLNCTFSGNSCVEGGCGLHLQTNSTAVVNDTSFLDHYGINSNDTRGGGVWAARSELQLHNCIFQNNNVTLGAGIMAQDEARVNVTSCKFVSNIAYRPVIYYGAGAGICLKNAARVYVNDSVFDSNGPANVGAGIAMLKRDPTDTQPQLYILNTTFRNGKCLYGGCGIWLEGDGYAVANNTVFEGHRALETGWGGVMFAHVFSTFNLDNCTFNNNTGTKGGAIFTRQYSHFNVTNSKFTDNHATFGGAVHIEDHVIANINSTTLAGNSASGTGGAINVDITAKLVLSGTTLEGNTVVGQGGGVYLAGNTVSVLESVVLQGNSARHGGAIAQATTFGSAISNLTIVNCTLADNQASQHGGALFVASATDISGSNLTNNRADNTGGGISLQDTGQLAMTGGSFSSNSATEGGGVYMTGTAAIHAVRFSGDAAERGGSMYIYSGNLTVEHSSFDSSSARESGGALQVGSTGLANVTRCSMTNCTAVEGGAIAVYGQVILSALGQSAAALRGRPDASSRAQCVLANNRAQRGGAVFVGGTGYVSVTGCSVSGCRADEHGGGVMSLEHSTLIVAGSIFTGNNASMHGGGLHIAGSAQLWDTLVEGNSAGIDGGGLAFDNNAEQFNASESPVGADASNRVYQGPTVLIQGARLSNCYIQDNQAGSDGGGMHVSGALELVSTLFQNNRANRHGGGLACDAGAADSSAANMQTSPAATQCSCSMNDTTFTGNKAVNGSGGAVYLMGRAVLRTLRLHSNSAGYDGGGIMCDSCDQIDAVDVVAVDNHARGNGGALSLVPLRSVVMTNANLTSNTAGRGGGAHLSSHRCQQPGLNDTPPGSNDTRLCISVKTLAVMINRAEGTPPNAASVTAASTVGGSQPAEGAEGKGGGLYVEASGDIELQDLQVSGNEAYSGAGVYMNTTGCSLAGSGAIRQCLLLERFAVEGNQEQPARDADSRAMYGPDMFVTKPEAVGVACTAAGQRLALLVILRLDGASGRCLEDLLRLDPSTVASGVHSLGIHPKPTDPPRVVSSRDNLNVQLQLLDMFGHLSHLPTTEKADFAVNITEPRDSSAQLLGAVLVQGLLNAPVNFSGLQLLADPGLYTLTFSSRQAYLGLPSVSLQLRVRECYAGESIGNHECDKCGERGQYSLMPNSDSCLSCEVYGNCSKGVLMPKPGFWHSHPRSPQLHTCLYNGACTYDSRDIQLLEFQDGNRPFNSTLISPGRVTYYRQLQCAEGYAGTLCASCRQGYGRNGPFCVPCRFKSAVSVALAAVILAQALIIMGQMIIFNLSIQKQACSLSDAPAEFIESIDARDDVKDEPSRGGCCPIGCCTDANVVSDGKPGIKELPPNASELGQPGGETRVSTNDGNNTRGALTLAGQESVPIQEPGDNRQVVQLSASDVERNLAEQATGALKILVEYVQILGIIRSVKLPMPVIVRNFLNSLDVTSASSSQMLYCSLWGSPSTRMISSVVFAALLPLAFVACSPILVGLSHIGISRFSRWRPMRQDRQDKYRHIIAAIIFVLLFFFPNVCRQLLLVFSVIKLDEPTRPAPPGTVLANPGWYWQNLPDVEYFHGAHKLLVVIVGIPGLLLYAVVFPVTLAALLYRRRNHLKEINVRIQYGMLYNDYREQRYYWQSVVMSVQLMLIMCAVLLTSVGTSVQLLSALVVVVMYQFLTVLARPFKHKRLMLLARIMLLAVTLTLVLMLYLNVVITDRSRTALIAMLLILNTAVAALLLGYIAHMLARSHSTRAVIKYLRKAVTMPRFGSQALQTARSSLTMAPSKGIPSNISAGGPRGIVLRVPVVRDAQDGAAVTIKQQGEKDVEMGQKPYGDSATENPTLCIDAEGSPSGTRTPDRERDMPSTSGSSSPGAQASPQSVTLFSLGDLPLRGPNPFASPFADAAMMPYLPRSKRI